MLQLPEQRTKCHALLYSRGQQYYEAADYQAARGVLTPALFFSGAGTYCKTARLLASCCSKLQQYDRALDYLDMADQQQAGCMLTQLLRMHVTLALGDQTACLQAVQGLARCPDAGLATLKVGAGVIHSYVVAPWRTGSLHNPMIILLDSCFSTLTSRQYCQTCTLLMSYSPSAFSTHLSWGCSVCKQVLPRSCCRVCRWHMSNAFPW